MEIIIKCGSVLLLLIAAALVWRSVVLRRDAMAKFNKVNWIKRETVRAATLLRSGQRADILAGLQILQALNDPTVLGDVLPLLTDLRMSNDPHIAAHAEETLLSLTRMLQHSSTPTTSPR